MNAERSRQELGLYSLAAFLCSYLNGHNAFMNNEPTNEPRNNIFLLHHSTCSFFTMIPRTGLMGWTG